jgi:hypothetical protein
VRKGGGERRRKGGVERNWRGEKKRRRGRKGEGKAVG